MILFETHPIIIYCKHEYPTTPQTRHQAGWLRQNSENSSGVRFYRDQKEECRLSHFHLRDDLPTKDRAVDRRYVQKDIKEPKMFHIRRFSTAWTFRSTQFLRSRMRMEKVCAGTGTSKPHM